jgi:uncharacterized protein YqeY
VNRANPVDDGGTQIRSALTEALKDAMRARDTVAASAIRTALSAIGNAESVVPGAQRMAATSSPHFAGAAAGLGAGEVARRLLTAAEVDSIVRAEIAERRQAADGYAASGWPDQADRLRREAGVLDSVMSAAGGIS